MNTRVDPGSYAPRTTYQERESYSEPSGPRCPRCTARSPGHYCKSCGPLPRLIRKDGRIYREVRR